MPTFPFTSEQIMDLVRHYPDCAARELPDLAIKIALHAAETGQMTYEIPVELEIEQAIHLSQHLVDIANLDSKHPVYGELEIDGEVMHITPLSQQGLTVFFQNFPNVIN